MDKKSNKYLTFPLIIVMLIKIMIIEDYVSDICVFIFIAKTHTDVKWLEKCFQSFYDVQTRYKKNVLKKIVNFTAFILRDDDLVFY